MLKVQSDWFINWFDSKYYHLLYKKRDDEEARQFIDALVQYLKPKKSSKFLDLACGSGRHSIHLNQKGFDVTGLDLSLKSVETACLQHNSALRFLEQDMRHSFKKFSYDYVLNLFTSFGYFDNIEDDEKVIKNVADCLNEEGVFVLDFFNSAKPNSHFNIPFTKTIDSVKFDILKKIQNGRIIKNITITDSGRIYNFTEQVRIYNIYQFKQLLDKNGLTLLETFGNYKLEPYYENTSERLILIAKK